MNGISGELRLDGTTSNTPAMYYALMGAGAPFILFIFIVLFGSDSYQLWEDRFDYFLTNKYLFACAQGDSVLGPLWRDDILSGYVWAGSMHTTPLAIDILFGRIFALAPLAIDLVGSLALYAVSVIGMYLYLRRIMEISVESATLSSVMFAATTYWMAFWHGSADFPMAAAWLPLLLYMTHAIEASACLHWADRLVRIVGFSFLCFAFAINTSVATLPFVLITLLAYILASFGLSRASLWNCAAASLGVLLYSPFLWQMFQIATLSPRYKITETGPQHFANSSSEFIGANASEALRQIMTNHNVFGLSLPAKLGLILFVVMKLTWKQESPRIRRRLAFAGGIAGIGLVAYSGAFDYANIKMAIPVLSGFAVGRFFYLMPVGVMVLTAWMFDRGMASRVRSEPDARRRVFGLVAYVGVGVLTLGHLAHVVGKLDRIPSFVAPQNYVLCGLFFVYGVATLLLLWRFYAKVFGADRTGSMHLLFGLMIVTVSLDTSIHAYKTNISTPKVSVAARPIMSYAERYRVSEELLRTKMLAETYGRAISLEPLSPSGWSYQGLAPLALARIPTIAGYAPLIPFRFQRLVNVAINGRDRAPYLTELIVDDNPALKLELLPLLNVGIILTPEDKKIAGYDATARLNPSGMVLHLVHDRSQLSRAFVSRSARCFGSDEEALRFIRHTPLEDLKSFAPLVMTDAAVADVCRDRPEVDSVHAHSERTKTIVGADRVTVEVDSAGGILNVADHFYPGWTVLVDGEPKPVLRTFTTLRGVQIGAGHHTVEYIFRPAAYYALLRMSCIVGAVLLAALCLALIKKSCIPNASATYPQTWGYS
ncbi:MAG: hypothetical protein HY914_13320 [Desulfomonile tiedjei]|nr:hypothetical protein [Desulfomonile tiedjei]